MINIKSYEYFTKILCYFQILIYNGNCTAFLGKMPFEIDMRYMAIRTDDIFVESGVKTWIFSMY